MDRIDICKEEAIANLYRKGCLLAQEAHEKARQLGYKG